LYAIFPEKKRAISQVGRNKFQRDGGDAQLEFTQTEMLCKNMVGKREKCGNSPDQSNLRREKRMAVW